MDGNTYSCFIWLIVYGLIVWGNVTDVNNAKDGMYMEVYAKQFGWTVRYAGEDNKLGDGHVRFYAPTNPWESLLKICINYNPKN